MKTIGLDFGNYTTVPCYIDNFQPTQTNRLGGTPFKLLPANSENGIHSTFYYSKETGRRFGRDAERADAKILENRLRSLKMRLDQEVVLDGETIDCNEVITELVQYCVRQANERLDVFAHTTSNQICLAYPVAYSCREREQLVELVEKATLEDGTHLKVVGTIREPAAAALDYLAENNRVDKDTTVLCYDLGGGTFDLALVASYPKGKKNAAGKLRYYDILDEGGIADLGGYKFDDIIYDLLCSKTKENLRPGHLRRVRNGAEQSKRELSEVEETSQVLYIGEDAEELVLKVTRAEFEAAIREDVMRTIRETKAILNRHPNQKADLILLTGGSSSIPLIQRLLEEELPEYKGKIVTHRPGEAVAFGTARFGVVEENTDPTESNSVVIQRNTYDLGVCLQKSVETKDGLDRRSFISTSIKAGTEIPCKGKYERCYTSLAQQETPLRIFEANKKDPDEEKIGEDYSMVRYITFRFQREVPEGTEIRYRMYLDGKNRLHVEASAPTEPDAPAVHEIIETIHFS